MANTTRTIDDEVAELMAAFDKPWHVFCSCNEIVAFCGFRSKSTVNYPVAFGPLCETCEELNRGPCPRCGAHA